MIAMYPASCSHCGAPVTGTLASDGAVPLYACRFAGRSHSRFARLMADPVTEPNVVPLTDDDWADLLSLVADVADGFTDWADDRAR